jgi:hypothetical protein
VSPLGFVGSGLGSSRSGQLMLPVTKRLDDGDLPAILPSEDPLRAARKVLCSLPSGESIDLCAGWVLGQPRGSRNKPRRRKIKLTRRARSRRRSTRPMPRRTIPEVKKPDRPVIRWITGTARSLLTAALVEAVHYVWRRY